MGLDLAKAPPAILVVPLDRNFSGVNVAPPLLEFSAWDVVCGWSNQVIEDYGVLFLPPKTGDSHQVIIVEKMPGYCATGYTIERSIDRLGREVNKGCGQF